MKRDRKYSKRIRKRAKIAKEYYLNGYTTEDICEALDIDVNSYYYCLNATGVLDDDRNRKIHEIRRQIRYYESDFKGVGRILIHAQDHELNDEADGILKKHLAENQAQVIRLRFGIDGRPHTYSEIGEKMDISRQRVNQVIDFSLDKLEKSLMKFACRYGL